MEGYTYYEYGYALKGVTVGGEVKPLYIPLRTVEARESNKLSGFSCP